MKPKSSLRGGRSNQYAMVLSLTNCIIERVLLSYTKDFTSYYSLSLLLNKNNSFFTEATWTSFHRNHVPTLPLGLLSPIPGRETPSSKPDAKVSAVIVSLLAAPLMLLLWLPLFFLGTEVRQLGSCRQPNWIRLGERWQPISNQSWVTGSPTTKADCHWWVPKSRLLRHAGWAASLF